MATIEPKSIRVGIIAMFVMLALGACSKKEEIPSAPVKPAKPELPVPVTPAKPGEPTVTQEQQPPPIAEPGKPAKPVTVSTLAAYFHFDEDRGATTTSDSSSRKLKARLNDGVGAGAPGMVKNAIDFSSSRKGQVTLFDPLDFETNTATVVAWVKRRGPQMEDSAIFYSRGGDTTAGLLVGKRGELSYIWGREKTSAGWISGLVLPDQKWAFVAIVVEPDNATLYLGVPGEPLWSAENAKPHVIADFSGAITLGRDPLLDSAFEGSLDELGFWKNSMSRDDVEKLFLVGQKMAAAQKEAAPVAAPPVRVTSTAASKEPPTPKESPSATPAKPSGAAAPNWDSAEFRRVATLYNSSVASFQKFMLTRENPSSLKHIEADVRSCVDAFERLKTGAPASLDLQTYIDRCNKLNFDIHAAKTLAP